MRRESSPWFNSCKKEEVHTMHPNGHGIASLGLGSVYANFYVLISDVSDGAIGRLYFSASSLNN
jgi:hypothetical protein